MESVLRLRSPIDGRRYIDSNTTPLPRTAEWQGPTCESPARKRDRLWELSSNLHCSIIGTCLSTADLRALLAKLGDPAARTASEHDLHSQAVGRAGRRDDGGKFLHKLLDRRHERAVARFARAGDVDGVRALWREAVAKGEIPGPYWAVLTHPATDSQLVKEAFGEVHMLSHLVGRSVRADLTRLTDLESEVAIQAELIADQAARIGALTDDKVDLARRLGEHIQERTDTAAGSRNCVLDEFRELETRIAKLQERLGRAEAHAQAEETRRAEAERALRALGENIRAGAERGNGLREEIAELEDLLAPDGGARRSAELPRLDGVTLLYVGGRPRQAARAAAMVERKGGQLLVHDGGVEESTALLPALVARADAVFFPVDCVSHDAVNNLKRACRDHETSFHPLRGASLAALLGAIMGCAPRGA